MIRKRIASMDDPAIYRLIVEQLVPYSKVYDHSRPFRQSDLFKRLRRNVTFVAAKGRKSPLGFITLFCKDRIMTVDMLAVDPAYQGRGYGKLLMETAETYGKLHGCKQVRLFVDNSNPRAIRFYQAGGYATTQYISSIACYLMNKPLIRSK